ncbi:hypothetical protein C0J52_28165, partial [Blattella germanica]
VFHICADGRKISFLCPNGTIFRQSHLICDWWWTVDCASSKEHYEESAEMLANDRKIYQARSDALSKSRARQRTNRKPGLIREFDGASASVAPVTVEPNPRNARIQAHSKVINTNKQFLSSTAKPNENSFSNSGFSRNSDEYQAAGSMEQAEQRQVHAFHPPFPETRTRRPFTGQLPEGRQASQSRQSPHNVPQLRNFKQNIPPAQGAPERQLAPSRDFLDIQPPPRPTSSPRQTAILFSPSDGERQLPAETGSFVNNRGNQLNGLQQSTPRPSKQRITPVPQNRVPQGSSKSYVELDRSRTTTPNPTEKPLNVALSQRVKPIVVQVTDRGLTGLSKNDKSEGGEGEKTTQDPPFDDDESDDGFPEPPSEEQFKDEDLFYLRSTTQSGVEDTASSTVTPEQEYEEDVDLDSELGLSKPPSEVQFKDEDLRGSREESKSVEDHDSDGPVKPASIPERSTAPSIKEEVIKQSSSKLTSLDISTTKMHRFRTPTTSTTPTPVEELEKKHKMTESSVSAEESPSTTVPSSPQVNTKGRIRMQTSATGNTETPTTKELSTDSTTAIPSSSVTESKRIHSPKQDITQTTSKPHSDKPIKSTTSIPPTTLYVTLSRRVQPPVLILSSTDPREKSKSKKDETSPRIKESFRTRTRTTTEGTTPVTISRRVRPPLVEVSTNVSPVSTTSKSTGTITRSREPSESSVSLQTVTASSAQSLNIEADQLPLEEDSADDLLGKTESSLSSSSSTRKSTTYVEIQRRKSTIPSSTTVTSTTLSPKTTDEIFTRKSKLTTTTPSSTTIKVTTQPSVITVITPDVKTSDNSSSNRPLEIGNSIKEIVTVDPELPKSLPLRQEPTPAPQFGNRDGLDIPASSGPSTLHSLAVYFASKDSQTETTSPAFDSSTQFDSKKRKGKDKTSTVSTPLASSTAQSELASDKTITVSTENDTDTSIGALNFLTQSTRDSYSSLFPNTKTEVSSTTEETKVTADFAQRIIERTKNKDRKVSESTSNTLRSELLNKLAEISQMESTPPTEERITIPERPVFHTDTEDLLQGTDSRDLRELAQIFSRALSAYLEDPEEFKKVLNEVRPKEPGNDSTPIVEIQHQSTTLQPIIIGSTTPTTSSAEYSSSVLDEEEEVLDFSDVSKVSRKKIKSTTPLPLPSKNIKPSKRKGSLSTTAPPSSSTFIPSVSSQNYPVDKDIDNTELKPPKERLQNAQTNYYTASRQQLLSGRVRNDVQGEIETSSSPTEVTSADYTLPPGSKQYTGPGYGAQADENFAPTAGGVNDPSRPRYGGFQNNSILSRKVSETGTQTSVVKLPDHQKITKATTLNPVSGTQSRIATKPRPASNATSKSVGNNVKAVTDAIGGLLNTFVPEEVNNLAEVGSNVESQNNNQYNKTNSGNSKPDETLVGANTASFSSSRVRESSNQAKSTRKWSNAAQGVDPLTINRELSASDFEVVEATTASAIEQSKTKPRTKVKSRNRSTSSISPLTSEDVKASTDSFSTTSSPVSVVSIKSTRSAQEIKSTVPTYSSKKENLDQYDDEKSDSEELKPSIVPDITFYSEKIKLPPPPSASLVRTSSRKDNAISPSSTTSSPSSGTTVVNVTDDRSFENNSTSTSTIKLTPEQSMTTLPISTSSSQKKASRTSGTKAKSNERNVAGSQLSSDSVESVKETSKQDPIQTVTQSRISTPMPFSETTLTEKQNLLKSTTIPPRQASTNSARPAKTVTKSSEPSSKTPTETTKRRKSTTTTQVPFSGEENDEIEILKDGRLKNNVSVSQILSTTTGNSQVTTSVVNTSSNVKNVQKSTSQNSRLSQDRTTQILKQSVANVSTKSPPPAMFAKIRMSSDSSEVSRLTASSEMNLSIEDVTSEQLQALEDLQTMLFPENITMSEDGTMFGNLNQSSTLSLINTMKEAVTNSTVRRLVLLLVNSLKENTPEETRKQLIEALLRMPIDRTASNTKEELIMARIDKSQSDKSSRSIGNSAPINDADLKKVSKLKNSETNTKTVENKESVSQAKITTQPPFRTRTKKPTQTTTKEPEMTTTSPSTTARSKGKKTARLRSSTEKPQTTTGRAASQGGEVALEDIATEADTLPQSDTRAVELLRSLYSLASRWG